MRDTAIETYDDFAGYVAENFNELFQDESEAQLASETDDREVSSSSRTD